MMAVSITARATCNSAIRPADRECVVFTKYPSVEVPDRLCAKTTISFPTVPVIVRDGQAAGDTGEGRVLGHLAGEQSLQQLLDGKDL